MLASRTKRFIIIGGFAALAAYLRLHAISAKSFWIDEGASVAIARLDAYNFLRILWRREANMTLYYLLLRGWLHLGDSEAWIRGLSVIFAVGTIPVVYLLGKRLFTRSAGMASALLLTGHAFHIRYSQEARSYTLAVFLVSLASLLFVDASERPTRRGWLAYSVVASLAVYAQFYSVLVIAAHFVWMRYARTWGEPELQPRARRAFLHVGIITLPVWIFILTTGAGPLRWLERPTLAGVARFVDLMTGNGGWVLVLGYAVAVAAAYRPNDPGFRFAAIWLALPVVLTIAVSFAKPLFLPRYMIIALPPLVLLAGAGIARLPRPAGLALLAGVVALSVAGTVDYYSRDIDIAREDWRSATAFVLRRASPSDAIIFYPSQGRMPYEYYLARMSDTAAKEVGPPVVVFPSHGDSLTWRDFMGAPQSAQFDTALEHGRVWVVLTHVDESNPVLRDGLSRLRSRLGEPARMQFPEVEILLFPGPSTPVAALSF